MKATVPLGRTAAPPAGFAENLQDKEEAPLVINMRKEKTALRLFFQKVTYVYFSNFL